jgi:hypothetical protein
VAALLCASAQAKGPASVPPPKYQFLSFQLLEIETAATASNFGPLGTTSFGGVSTFRCVSTGPESPDKQAEVSLINVQKIAPGKCKAMQVCDEVVSTVRFLVVTALAKA